MANGTYGTTKPAVITENDADIFYFYRPSYSSDAPNFTDFKQISGVLTPADGKYDENGQTMVLPGMYNLRLPLDIFSEKGIYTVYIKPKEVFATIVDGDAYLANQIGVRGIVLNTLDINEKIIAEDGELTGYRIEYLDDQWARTGDYRIITSNNKCEPVSQYGGGNSSSVKYRFNTSSNLTFCTVTPSASLSFKDSLPSLGMTGQKIAVVNTKFNPVCIEIEMVDSDMESLTTLLGGSQLRDCDMGVITTFDDNGGIVHQASYGNIINADRGINHEFKIKRDSEDIDFDAINKFEEIKERVNG